MVLPGPVVVVYGSLVVGGLHFLVREPVALLCSSLGGYLGGFILDVGG